MPLRALAATAAMTAGFAAVFGTFGLLIGPSRRAVSAAPTWVTIGIGVTLAVLGRLVGGRARPAGLRLPQPERARAATPQPSRSAGFGAAYADRVAELHVGPFLAIVASSFRPSAHGGGSVCLLAYAIGMGMTVPAAALAVALAAVPLVGRPAPCRSVHLAARRPLLLLAGGYVAYYGWWEVVSSTSGATTIRSWTAPGDAAAAL